MKERRTILGVRLVDLSRLTGISGKDLWRIENDPDCEPNSEVKILICKALGATVEEIFGD